MVGDMGDKKRSDELAKRTADSPVHERFRDTYQRDCYATRRQARGYG